ncbi:MAG TPA: DMT family transporter [Patescibacteria group bacterium]|nr:DMT family transporter [Patescibacteria group bacterium]
MSAAPRSRHSPYARAVLAMIVAVGLFSFMDAGMKWLSPHYPPMQIAALRGLSSAPLVFLWAIATVAPVTLVRIRWSMHLLRGALSIFMLATFAYALKRLPMADAYTLFFIAPLLITALSAPLLGERVGTMRWVAIAVGMIGVIVAMRPTGQGWLSLGSLAAIASALGYSLSAITVRTLGKTDSTQSMVLWMTVMVGIGAGLLAWPEWIPIASAHWPAIIIVGVSGALAQYAVTIAFKLGEASAIAPFEYTALAWGVLLDWLLWQTLPDRYVFIGAGIIVASGVYLIRRERVHAEAEHP